MRTTLQGERLEIYGHIVRAFGFAEEQVSVTALFDSLDNDLEALCYSVPTDLAEPLARCLLAAMSDWPSAFEAGLIEAFWSTLDVGSLNGTHEIDGPVFQGGGRKASWPSKLEFLRSLDASQVECIRNWVRYVHRHSTQFSLHDDGRLDRIDRFWSQVQESGLLLP